MYEYAFILSSPSGDAQKIIFHHIEKFSDEQLYNSCDVIIQDGRINRETLHYNTSEQQKLFKGLEKLGFRYIKPNYVANVDLELLSFSKEERKNIIGY